MAGTQWIQDTRPPFAADDLPTITLLTTSLMLYPAALWTPTYSTDWYTGKRFQLDMWGRMTTAATPGNLTIEVRYGTTDAGGTILATSAATALAASKTAISWELHVMVRCRDINATTGANGSLFCMGSFQYDGASSLFTTTSQNPLLFPAATAAATAVDLTTTSGISVQMKRSGSTAETAIVHDLSFQALN